MSSEDNRWSLQDEVSNLFNASLDRCFPTLQEDADFFPGTKTKPDEEYTCHNVLSIWPRLRESRELRAEHQHIERPKDVGKAIKKNLPEYAFEMIERPLSVSGGGYVTFSLSPKWMAQRIHTMLKNGIDTWTPKLPVERVLVKYPSLDEEIYLGQFRRGLIAETLVRMLNHSKVDATMAPTIDKDMHDSPLIMLKQWFSIGESIEQVQVGVEDKPPFILAKKDLNHLDNDLEALRYGFKEENADLIVYVAPVRQQEYIEMCFTVAKLEKWTPTDGKWECIPDGTSYVGYRTCNTGPKELASLLDGVDHCCSVMARDEDAQFLGYNATSVSNCVLMYTFLKSPRMANCAFISSEMVGEEGNTFVHLLNTRDKIRRITNDYREDINELMEASELVLDINEQSEIALEFQLLEFTEALKRSCQYLSPHILCDYLYFLSQKFTNYYSSVCGVDPVAKSTLLLCEAAGAVMDKCFILLGLMPNNDQYSVPFGLQHLRNRLTEQDKRNKEKIRGNKNELVDRCIGPSFFSRDPRNSRFEVFSIRSFITDPHFRMGKMFGYIAVSDKYGSIPDGGSHLFEPDFTYVSLFDHEWCEPIDMHDGEYICLGNLGSPKSVSFSSSIEIIMELYVTSEKKKEPFKICRTKFELDLANIWGRSVNNECSCIEVKGMDGYTELYYMLIKDAVDAFVEIRYEKETINKEARGGKVCAHIYAYYGSDVLNQCRDSKRSCYWALLFRSVVPVALEEGEKIPLKKSVMAVPKGAPLKIFAHLYDMESDGVIMDGICELSSLTEGSSKGYIKGFDGTGCSLSVSVKWKYQAVR